MNVPRFDHEHWLADREQKARHVLGTSGVAAPPIEVLSWETSQRLDYGEFPQDPRLVRAIAAARGVPESRVLVTVGATEGLLLAPLALVKAGARVLVETPTYHPLAAVPEMLGARVERVARRADHALDVDALIERLDDDVALVSVTNPNNPTGRLTPAADLVKLARACERVGAWLLVDEAYRGLVQPRTPPAHTLHPRIVSLESLTKSHGLGGLRVGWALAAPAARDAMREAKAYTSLVNAASTAALAVEALHHEERLLARGLRFTHDNRTRFAAFDAKHPGLAWRAPECPLVGVVRVPEGLDDVAWCESLFREAGVLLAPGTNFGLPGYVRIGFGAEPQAFAEGLDAFGAWLTAHPP